jgi:hypothetical protein
MTTRSIEFISSPFRGPEGLPEAKSIALSFSLIFCSLNISIDKPIIEPGRMAFLERILSFFVIFLASARLSSTTGSEGQECLSEMAAAQ